MEGNKDTYSYKGWLNSDSFIKRAFGVLGYYSIASIILVIVFLICALLLGINLD